jgi:hypothetical protein
MVDICQRISERSGAGLAIQSQPCLSVCMRNDKNALWALDRNDNVAFWLLIEASDTTNKQIVILYTELYHEQFS